ncbi:uncharacterized protein [Apostichopus japonicus]|uniref:uncharacterized protein isoform X2 n=1 Tax=Stichopus japonicus TaxID=307972 RepID=UPI003AB5C6CC
MLYIQLQSGQKRSKLVHNRPAVTTTTFKKDNLSQQRSLSIMSIIKLATTAIMIIALAKLSLLDGFSVMESLAVIRANIGYYLAWPSQPVLALLVGSLAIISVIGYRFAWPSQPGKTSLIEAYKQNICPMPLPWEEYFLATDGKKKIIKHDQLNSKTNLYAETQVQITWPDGKAEKMSTLSFFKSDKSKTLRRVLFVGDIGCGKTSFVKQQDSNTRYDNQN